MRIFTIKNLSHDFLDKSLFHKAELNVQDGRPGGTPDHIGLVGPNGCGKTTFLKMLCGEIVPDEWTMEASGRLSIGYLDQYADLDKNLTVYDYLDGQFAPLYALDRQVSELYDSIAKLSEEEKMKAAIRAQNILEELDAREFDRIGKKIDSVLTGLGFSEADRSKTVSTLSGGMKTKLILAKILLADHNLLVLDEPTNFLDIGYIQWLGDYLCRLDRAFIVISHDRALLNRISNKIVEIANRKFKVYEGDYDFYIEEKARREAVQEQQHKAQEKYIARAEQYVLENSPEATGGIMRTKATWLKRMLETLERIERPDEIIKPRFAFRHQSGASSVVLTLWQAEVGYAGAAVLPPVTLSVGRGEKIVFKGFNGIGKTTLLKTICGDLPLVGGEIGFGTGITSVYLKQEEDYENNFSHFDKHQRRLLGLKKGRQHTITVMEFAKEYFPERSNKDLQTALFSCGLNETHLYNQVRNLSGGEMTKLRLCLAMINPVNLIVLDEPTNHLDMYSKEVLTHALSEFPGTVLMTTHDTNADLSWACKIISLEELFL